LSTPGDATSLTERGKRPKAAKGRVREAMMNLLAQQPYTLTDLSRILKVSKPTISYHLAEFTRKGLIQGAGVRVGRGGLTSRLFVMKHGVEFILPDSDSDSYYLDTLSGIFEEKKLVWTTSGGEISWAREMTDFLYHTFRLLRNITKTRHHDILRRYGVRIGTEVFGARVMTGKTVRDRLASLKTFWNENEIGNIQVLPGGTAYLPLQLFQCLGCFGTRDNGGPLCSLTRGIVQGVLQSGYGSRYEVGERQTQGSWQEVCMYPIRKARKRSST
jgi:predicted hydrocarbon binding protein